MSHYLLGTTPTVYIRCIQILLYVCIEYIGIQINYLVMRFYMILALRTYTYHDWEDYHYII